MTPEEYLRLRSAVVERGYADMIAWSEGIARCAHPDDFWEEFAWVVLNSGMREQIARGIWNRVRTAVLSGASASTVFGHKGKAAAIDHVRSRRQGYYVDFAAKYDAGDVPALLEWLRALPWIGEITCWHLAKNLGVDCAKPDRHLVRIAGAEGTHNLCARLSKATGDRIATVDVVIWRGANLGLI